MSNVPGKPELRFYNWQGMDDRPGIGDPTKASFAFNVQFKNGVASRRPGRQPLMLSPNVSEAPYIRATKILWYNGTAVTDVTNVCTDGDFVTSAIANPFANAGSYLLIGFPVKVSGVRFTVISPLLSNTTLSAAVFNRASGSGTGAWTTIASTLDTTAISGFTFKQAGTLSWDAVNNAVVAVGWGVGAADATLTAANVDQDLYWLKITTAATGGAGTLAEIQGTLYSSWTNNSLVTETSGMVEYATKTGERTLVITNELPGRFNDSLYSYPADNRIFALDLGRNEMVPLRVPNEFRSEVIPGTKTSFSVFNGWLIGCTSAGYLWKYKNDITSALECMPGMDLQNNVVGAQGYLLKTPRGTQLEIYRNRLMVACDPSSPMTFYASLEDNNLTVIPASASVGGPNVWPLRYVFNVPGREGDKIISASVVNDLYVIFTRTQTWVFDDNSLRLVNGDVGCVSANSVQKIENAVYFLSDLGIFVTDGTNVTNISAPIWKTLTSLANWQGISINCTSSHDRSRGEYRLYFSTKGDVVNTLCAVYDYIGQTWTFWGGWYPNGQQADINVANGPVEFSATASCQAIGADGHQVLLTSDMNGNIWQENKGFDDNGIVPPAYMILPVIGSGGIAQGEDFLGFRDWYVMTDMDGTYLECFALGEGDNFDQELDRLASAVATRSENHYKQRLLQYATPAKGTSNYYTDVLGTNNWPQNFGQPIKMKMSFGRLLTKMQPVIHWLPGPRSGRYFDTTNWVWGSGNVYDVQIDVARKGGPR